MVDALEHRKKALECRVQLEVMAWHQNGAPRVKGPAEEMRPRLMKARQNDTSF
jgi:hypothetical protein